MLPSKTTRTRTLQHLLSGLILLIASQATANECLALLPADAVEDGLPRICESDFNGINSHYSCQDYRVGDHRYRALYKGGIYPKAILQRKRNNPDKLLSATIFGDQKLRCPLPPPAGVPEHATHLGTGICHDDNDHMIACSVYEHVEARQLKAHRYITFYGTDPNGERMLTIDTQVAGRNENAMVAELAFQLGLSLWDTECCADQALDYLAYAYQLFPNTKAYREAYHQRQTTLTSSRELD